MRHYQRKLIANEDLQELEKKVTQRERQVLQLATEGLNRKEIAVKLSLSPNTVHFHLENIYKKLDLHSQVDLLRRVSGH